MKAHGQLTKEKHSQICSFYSMSKLLRLLLRVVLSSLKILNFSQETKTAKMVPMKMQNSSDQIEEIIPMTCTVKLQTC